MKRIVVATSLVGAVVAMFGAGVTGTYLTSQAQVAENVVKVGAVTVSAEPTASALSIDPIAPGSVVPRTLTVANTGSLPVTIVCTASKKAGITDLFNALTVRATGNGGAVLYDGPLSTLKTVPVTLEKAASEDLVFAVGLPAETGNDLAADYSKFSIYVDAEQAR